MAITQVREVARADMNDELQVSLWQDEQEISLSTDEAREYAREIVAAADETDRVRLEMQREAEQVVTPDRFIAAADGSPVL